jgi:hypothetical protein
VRRLAALGRAGQAEKVWIAGRATLEEGRQAEGLALLRWSVGQYPTLRRGALLLALHLAAAWRGQRRPVPAARHA